MNMPIPEFQDYLLLINQQVEEEQEEAMNDGSEHQKSDTPTIKDAFPGTFTPHL
jgi:hypothetical protein